MFQLPFQRLGIFNWFVNNALDFRFRKFHVINPQERAEHLEEAVQRFEDAYNNSDNHNRLVYDSETGERVRKRHRFELKKVALWLGYMSLNLMVVKECMLS